MENYYNKSNTGGAAAGRGLEYQDLCAMKYYLENVDREDFVSLTLEQTNDFSLLFKDNTEQIYQVKKYKLSKKGINDILCKIPADRGKKYALIASLWNKELCSVLLKIKEYRNACTAQRPEAELVQIRKNLQDYISARGYSPGIMDCEFLLEPDSEDFREALLYRLYTWQKRHGYESDEHLMLLQLGKTVAEQRCRRGSLNYYNLVCIAENSKRSPDRHFTAPELSTHRETVLASLNLLSDENRLLQDPLTLAAAYIDGGNLQKASDVLTELEKTFPKVSIYRAWILLELEDYDAALKECGEILNRQESASSHSAALFYKGIIAFKRKYYEDACTYIRESISSAPMSAEQAEYLARSEIALGTSLDEAQELLENCVASGHISSEIYYELAALYSPYKSIDLLEKAVSIDADNLKARRLLAENYRFCGENSMAYIHYLKYFSVPSTFSDWRTLQGMIYCLISLGKTKEAEYYLLRFIDGFISNEGRKLRCQEPAVILDLTWNKTHILTCTKTGAFYNFTSPLGECSVPVNRNNRSMLNKDFIGAVPDSLLLMSESMRCQNTNERINIDNIIKPFFAANYDDDLAFFTKKRILIDNDIAHLNHDYEETHADLYSLFCYNLKPGDKLHYQEYIVEERDISIKIYESARRLHVHTSYKNKFEQTSSFINGPGFRSFRKAMNSSAWLSWYFYSVNRKELIDLCIPVKCVEIIPC